MKKSTIKRVGLYDPYLDVLGGGEKLILSILQVLADEGYEINIFWNQDFRPKIKERFLLRFIDKSKFLPNIFNNKNFIFSTLKTLSTLRTFDYFFYVTDGSYFFSSAKQNFIYAMVPNKNLYQLNFLNRLKLFNYKFISVSVFTQKHLQNWGIKSRVIYPYIDDQLVNLNISKVNKQPIILSIGRFFGHLHAKKHANIINTYKKLKQVNPEFKNFKLILAGGLKEEDKEYFDKLKKLIRDDSSIVLKPNISIYELYKLYKLSAFFWHFTGYSVDENTHPEQVEHLGIAPLEAMTAGCLTFCCNAGGPKEIIKDGQNGFLFKNEKELIDKMQILMVNKDKQRVIQLNAQKYIKKNFSFTVFSQRVKEIILTVKL